MPSKYLGMIKPFCRDSGSGEWRVVRGLSAFAKAGVYQFLLRRRVGEDDYAAEYNRASSTYHRWVERMGKHAARIVDFGQLPVQNGPSRILDLAAGTGFLSRRIVKEWDRQERGDLLLEAVDVSEKMLAVLREHCTDSRLATICQDAVSFLEQSDVAYDAIFFGWALPYFERRRVLSAIANRLKTGGTVHCICNSEGTLSGLQEIFVDVLVEHPKMLAKVPPMTFQLPAGATGLSRWFQEVGLRALETGEGEEIVIFECAAELLRWLRESGALVGTGGMFRNAAEVEPFLIERVEKRMKRKGGYGINHRFAHGIFRKDA